MSNSPEGDFEKRLRDAMRAKGFEKPSELARASGLNPVTVAAYCRGTRGFSLEAAFHMGQALGVDPMFLFYGKYGGSTPNKADFTSFMERNTPKIEAVKHSVSRHNVVEPAQNKHYAPADQITQNVARKKIPLYASALAGKDGAIPMDKAVVDMIDAPAPIADVEDAYGVLVAGDSMEPRYESGETVYVHPRKPVKKGDYVLIQIAVGDEGAIEGLIKRFVSINDETLVVSQLNPEKELKFARERVKSVHKIVLAG